MSEAKAGTFWCWLFGHKFARTTYDQDGPHSCDYVYTEHRTDYCVRCGAARKE